MGILATLAQPRASAPGPLSDFWYGPVGWSSPTAAGVRVSPDLAMRVSAVFACVSLISDTTASLPLHLYRRDGDDRARATDDRRYGLLHDQPNPIQTAMEYRQFKMVCALLRGNSYSYMWPDDRGGVRALLPLHPDYVTPEPVQVATTPSGLPVYGLRYRVRLKDGTEKVMLADEIHHVRGLSLDGLVGVSVIEYARQTVGTSLAIEEYKARFFGNGARPGGVLSPKQNLSKDALERLETQWNAKFQGPANAHKIAVLPVEVSYESVGITNEDAQTLELSEYEMRDVARWFRVPLHMIGETTKETSWGTGIEQMGIGFVTYCLGAWLTREEQALKRDLIPEPDLFAEHDVKGLLRGDFATRQAGLQVMRQNGVINARDWARIENLPPPEGDAASAYWRPGNMADADAPPPAPAPPQPAQLPPGGQP